MSRFGSSRSVEIFSSSETESLTYNGSTLLTVKYGDLFTPEVHDNNVILIPNFYDGVLYNLYMRILRTNGITFTYTLLNHGIVIGPGFGRVKTVLLVEYNLSTNVDPSDFYTNLFKCLDEKNLLDGAKIYVPTFGVKNNVSYYNSALSIFFGIKAHIIDETSLIHKTLGITVLTPYSPECENRAITHLFNMLRYEKKKQNEDLTGKSDDECVICLMNKAYILLSCGHRIMCVSCFKRNNNLCPICKAVISSHNECVTKIKVIDDCCGENKKKLKKINLPCGHYESCCDQCDQNSVGVCFTCKAPSKSVLMYEV